jgi:hypothetical protein
MNRLSSTSRAPASSSSSSSSSVFPLPLFSVPPPTRASSRGLTIRRSRLRAVYTAANNIIFSLNLLYFNCPVSAVPASPRSFTYRSTSSSSSFSSSSPFFSPATCRILDHVFRSARRFLAESRLRNSSSSPTAVGQVGTPSPSHSSSPVPALVQAIRYFIVREMSFPSSSSSSVHRPRVPTAAAGVASSSSSTFSSLPPLFVRSMSSLSALPLASYSLPCSALPLVAARVSLPDVPRKVNMLDLLPSAMRELYSSPEKLLLPTTDPASTAATALRLRPRVFGSKREYLALIRRMYALGMVSFQRRPKCINGVFTVKKDESALRLIIDARPANARFIRPHGVRLPDPSCMLLISIPADEMLYVGKNDIKDFYHSILLPEWLVPYFGLPAVSMSELGLADVPVGADGNGSGDLFHPVCLTVPMGWSHAVLVAQIDHEHVLYRDGALSPQQNLLTMTIASPALPAGTAAHTIYIDDGPTFSTSQAAATDEHTSMQRCYRANHLQPKLPKCQAPTADPIDVLGLEWHGKLKTVGAGVDKLSQLCALTLSYLRHGYASGEQMSKLVGSWVWPLLVRRPALSSLRHVYRFIHCAGEKHYQLWPSVKRELLILLGLAPLLYVDLSAAFFDRLFMSDASSTGGGVVSTPLSSTLADLVWPMACLPPTCAVPPAAAEDDPVLQPALSSTFSLSQDKVTSAHATIASSPWTALAAWKWKHTHDSRLVPTHINQLELQAALTAVKRVASSPSGINSRVLLGIDSSVALHVLRRGRTSSHSLYPVTCRLHALCLAAGIRIHTFWVPSDVNPADAPSRLL